MDEEPKYLLRDRDAIYGKQFSQRAQTLGIKDSPNRRPVQFSNEGRIVELSKVGGLHHHYLRKAA